WQAPARARTNAGKQTRIRTGAPPGDVRARERRRLLLAAHEREVRLVVRLAPEERLHQRSLLGAAALRQHLGAPRRGGRLVQEALFLEAAEHVAREREGPLVAVVARVVADEVAEARLEVRALHVGERVDRLLHLLHDVGAVEARRPRV